VHTPYYVIHKNELEENLLRLKEALHKYWDNAVIGYSFKTNSLPWLITFMKHQGCFAEVVSDDEYRLAKKLGYPAKQIIYNGPIKSKETFCEAVKQGAIVNIDSKRELDWMMEIGKPDSSKIGLRVNFDVESKCPGETQCREEDGRFGFSCESGELEQAVKRLEKLEIPISGLHLHCSSKTRSLNIYTALSGKAAELIKKYNLQLDYIDIGGGFFGGLPEKPSFEAYLKTIAETLASCVNTEKTTLIVEPGMSVVGAYMDYVTTVTDIKDTLHNRFVVTDGSRTNIDPLMTKSSYFYEIHSKNKKPPTVKKQTICGFTCMEHDRLFQLSDQGEISVGDQIVYHKTGAYTLCLTPLFIQFFPAVYVKTEGKYTCVRRKWTEEDFLAGNSLYNGV